MTRPINADVPAVEAGKTAPEPAPAPVRARKAPRRRRKPVPGALKAVAGLFALAIVFIVAAIVGGGGGGEETATQAPAPVNEAPSTPAETPAAATPEQLGYPGFATANTTRVGGDDAASSAAAVALAAYPSARPSQRPAAVTVVDTDDWQTAIASAVLMAPPVGAPLLVSEADGMPDPTAEALAALAPAGGKETGGAQVFAIGAADTPDDLRARRLRRGGAAGAAAIAALREKLAGSPRHIVVAPSADAAFAMPAAAWAARSGDPVLFTGPKALAKPTAAALKTHPRTPVFVLGPSSVVSSDVVREIAAIAPRVRRVSGEDPVANAIELARYSEGGFGWNVNDPGHGFVVAGASEPLDAAAAAPLSASGTWGPLLLTDDADTLPTALRGYLLDVKPGYTSNPTRAFYNHVWVIGDQEAISVNEQAEIDELAALVKIGGGE